MTRDERIHAELELVVLTYGELEIDPALNWFVVKRFPLPQGWNSSQTSVLVLIPSGYPTTPPDNFYTDGELRLADGRPPGSTTANQHQADRIWLMFSYHVEPSDWSPSPRIVEGHNLLTFLAGVDGRLKEMD